MTKIQSKALEDVLDFVRYVSEGCYDLSPQVTILNGLVFAPEPTQDRLGVAVELVCSLAETSIEDDDDGMKSAVALVRSHFSNPAPSTTGTGERPDEVASILAWLDDVVAAMFTPQDKKTYSEIAGMIRSGMIVNVRARPPQPPARSEGE